MAEQQGSVVSAVSLSDGRAIADPFVATADTVALLVSGRRNCRLATRRQPERAPPR